ncbi:hypothetical protein O6H91_03G074200 [Diphasiastrum complanatum]|uniref:Uncharacterized protein n=1 Tax=Diphasiastrum complanatum TaxID=34168 RepID=A0ACC2E7W0_DIPCM|nr:hypothetical protein O6H91_03G074200 [Diphasiastrum complanatum]
MKSAAAIAGMAALYSVPASRPSPLAASCVGGDYHSMASQIRSPKSPHSPHALLESTFKSASSLLVKTNFGSPRQLPTSPKRLQSKCVCAASDAAVFRSEKGIPSLYELLGVDDNVGLPEIKRAYRQMALQYHPDVCSPDQIVECTDKFVQAQHAYQILSDPELRADYDYHRIHLFSVPQASGNASKTWQVMKEWKLRWEAQLEYLATRSPSNSCQNEPKTWGSRMRQRMGAAQMC